MVHEVMEQEQKNKTFNEMSFYDRTSFVLNYGLESTPKYLIPPVEVEVLKESEIYIIYPLLSSFGLVVLMQAWESSFFNIPLAILLVLEGVVFSSVSFVLYKTKRFEVLSWFVLIVTIQISITWLRACGGLIIDIIEVSILKLLSQVPGNHVRL